jgi:acetylornithine deacetylase/succinyl-diaminopimelate desuccinylase-like protein
LDAFTCKVFEAVSTDPQATNRFRTMTTSGLAKVTEYLDTHHAQFEQELFDLLRIPSVSAVSQHRGDVRRAAEWVKKQFASLDFEVDLIDTPGHPVVLARSPDVPGAATVLVYGHYDVQPPEPLAEWITPPFEPTVRDGKIYARGSTDDKGQMLTHIKSAQAWTKVGGGLPVNLVYLIEGEEEIGSSHLDAFIDEHKDQLACDVAVISDTAQFGPEQPAITYGLKGFALGHIRRHGDQSGDLAGAHALGLGRQQGPRAGAWLLR